jgi:hypothetical protein
MKIQIATGGIRNLVIKKKILDTAYRIFVPGSTGCCGVRSDAESPAARIIPLLSTPKILAGS